jgi:hypothetical protein
MNKNMLISIMKLHGDNQSDLADYLGIALQTCNAKINQTGGARFDMIEIGKIKRKYNMTAEQVDMTFFASGVSCEDTEE